MGANTRFETLGDVVRNGGNIALACDGCRRNTVISGNWLYRKFFVHRWDLKMHRVGEHLRCGRCGARPDLIRVTHQKPTVDLPPRSEGEWRKLAHRLRG